MFILPKNGNCISFFVKSLNLFASFHKIIRKSRIISKKVHRMKKHVPLSHRATLWIDTHRAYTQPTGSVDWLFLIN